METIIFFIIILMVSFIIGVMMLMFLLGILRIGSMGSDFRF